MLQKTLEIQVKTKDQRLINITGEVEKFLASSEVGFGLINICILHTSASLLIQENASKDVMADLLDFYDKLAPMKMGLYQHNFEGLDDMPAHIKASLTNTNLTLSIINKRLKLGIWQGIYLFEHRIGYHQRDIFCHLLGDK
tara:strand:+ start:250 stop:672 length:423 start_codon:yes stop_codon:yes gene_type:complete